MLCYIHAADTKVYARLIDCYKKMHEHNDEMAGERESVVAAECRKIHKQYQTKESLEHYLWHS